MISSLQCLIFNVQCSHSSLSLRAHPSESKTMNDQWSMFNAKLLKINNCKLMIATPKGGA